MARREAYMKGTKILAIALAATFVTGCSSINPFSSNEQTGVKDTTVNTDFQDDGVRVSYSLFGELESIEVIGVSESWKRQRDVIAEHDAKEKLVKFIYGEDFKTNTTTRVIAKSLDIARDAVQSGTAPENIDLTEDDIKQEMVTEGDVSSTTDSDVSKRITQTVENTIVETTTDQRSGGRLVGFTKRNQEFREDGKVYVATYRWDKDDEQARVDIIKSMSR